MRKNFLVALVILTLVILPNVVFGGCGECKIKDGPAPSLDEYISNLRKVISNISSEIGSAEDKFSRNQKKSGLKKDLDYIKSRIIQTYNKMLNWGSYYSYFDFYVIYSMKNEYVAEIWRDYNLLERESEGLDKYLKFMAKKGYSGIFLSKDKVCSGVKAKCDFEGDVLDVVGEVIKNHENIKDYYRLSIIGKKDRYSGQELKLVGDNFESDFSSHYNENTTNNCSQCEPSGFFARISKEIEKISNWQKNTKDGMKSWQEAIDIITGKKDKREYEMLERKLLEKELRRNGMSTQASENILKNLSRYNETGGFSLDNNFITNSYLQIKDTVKSQIRSFTDSILELFRNKEKQVSILEVGKTYDNTNTTKNIEETIREMYAKELPYAQLQDVSTENLQSKIIELHYNIAQSIYFLDKTRKTSEKICNDQGNGLGKCETR